jgi:hypothetical protein
LLTVIATVALTIGAFVVVLPPAAEAVTNTCRARNVTKDAPNGSNLQIVIDAADPGDTIAVRYVCVGAFQIGKDLTIRGRSTPGLGRPILDGNDADTVVRVGATVTIVNLTITGGQAPASDYGGGIANSGTLTLTNSVVRGNRATEGAGIYNSGTITLNGSSNVRRNASGEFFNDGVATLNDSSSVTLNRLHSALYNAGTLTLNDSATVAHNRYAGIDTEGTVVMNGSSSLRRNGFTGIVVSFGGDLTMNGSSSISANGQEGIENDALTTMNDSASVEGNQGAHGGVGTFGTFVMNGSSRVIGNAASRSGGGLYVGAGTLTLNDSSFVRGNRAEHGGGGIANDGILVLNGSSRVTRNTAQVSGGGVVNRQSGSTELHDTAFIHGNTADADDDGIGVGGGILCKSGSVMGAIDGGNVNDNYRGLATPVEDNIVLLSC